VYETIVRIGTTSSARGIAILALGLGMQLPACKRAAPAALADAKAPKEWLVHLRAGIHVKDSRSPADDQSRCWSGQDRSIVYCGSANSRRQTPALRDASMEHLEKLLGCAAEEVSARPADYQHANLSFTIGPSGVSASPAPQTILDPAGYRACVDRAATALAASESGAASGTLEVTLSFSYEHWCEEALGEGVVVRVRDVKESPRWNLVPNSKGYRLAMCSSPAAWSLDADGPRVKVTDATGKAAGSVERTADGFEVKNAAGVVVRRGKNRGAELHVEGGDGAPIGVFAERAAEGGKREVFTTPAGRETSVGSGRGRHRVDWFSVEPDSIRARGAAVLADEKLEQPLQGALVVFFLLGLDSAK
jgi:hypothetical protein